MPKFALFLLALLLILPATPSRAQDAPEVPEALQILVDRGAQIRYLGDKHGMQGWITIFQGQEQYYYVTPDGQGFVLGLLFNKDGSMATMDQVRELQSQSDDVLDFLAADVPRESMEKAIAETSDAFDYKSPAERMFSEVENSNFVSFGESDAPVIYSFMDPQCPHCHDFMNDLREGYIDKGLIQVRMIPVGFREETLAQSAFLLAAPDAKQRWYSHLDGDANALPAKRGTNTSAIERNLQLMQNYKFNVTPMTVYRGKDGKVKIIRGRAENISTILADLPS
jgi:thiol:disulfide interchange protein DsbG